VIRQVALRRRDIAHGRDNFALLAQWRRVSSRSLLGLFSVSSRSLGGDSEEAEEGLQFVLALGRLGFYLLREAAFFPDRRVVTFVRVVRRRFLVFIAAACDKSRLCDIGYTRRGCRRRAVSGSPMGT